MNTRSLRRAIVAAAFVAGAMALASATYAQAPPGPPVCGGVASLMNQRIFIDGLGVLGDNIMSIPAVSPLQNNPSNPSSNGFQQLCNRFGLNGSTTTLVQFNAQSGSITTFTCDSVAAPPWQQGQALIIRPSASANGRIPGSECAQPYTAYQDGLGVLGDSLWPTPITFAGDDPEDVCDQFGLPDTSSTVTQHLADSGTINTHTCGTVAQFSLVVGQGLLIRAGATTTGTPTIF